MARLTRAQEAEIVHKTRANIGEGISHCETKHSRCEENQEYTRGLQWSAGDIERQAKREKPAVPWNSVFKVVHAISNKEMVSRNVPKVFGRHAANEGIANVLDEMCRWQRQFSSSEQVESMAFRNACIGGYGVAHKYWDPVASNGDGAVTDEDVPIWEMLWPARARMMNLSDRRWHIRGRWLTFDEVDELWGSVNRSVKNKIKRLRTQAKLADAEDGGITDTSSLGDPQRSSGTVGSWGWEHVRQGVFTNLAQQEIFVVEHEWQETEYIWQAILPKRFWDWVAFEKAHQPLVVESMDPQSQQPTQVPVQWEQYQQMDPAIQDQFRQAVLSETEDVEFENRSDLSEVEDLWDELFHKEFDAFRRVGRRTVKFAILVDDKVVDSGTRPYGYSYHFITGFPFETRDGMDYFGAVDVIKGPQDYKNALISNMLAMYMSSPKAPFLIEKSLVTSEMADMFASPSGLVVVPDGFFSSERHKVMPAPQYPPMIGPLLDMATGGVEQSLGLSSIDTGAQDDLRRVSGKVVQAAQLASNVIVAILFDSMRKFRREYGLCNVRFLRYMYEPEEMIEIVGEDKAEDVPQDPEAWEDILCYDIVIDEQPSSPTELMETLDFLTRTGELSQMRARGDIQFEDQLDLMPQIPASIKRKILKNRTIAEQKAMADQQAMQAKQELQSFYQYLSKMNGGEQILQGFTQMYQNQQFSQQLFSQPGVPQAQ